MHKCDLYSRETDRARARACRRKRIFVAVSWSRGTGVGGFVQLKERILRRTTRNKKFLRFACAPHARTHARAFYYFTVRKYGRWRRRAKNNAAKFFFHFLSPPPPPPPVPHRLHSRQPVVPPRSPRVFLPGRRRRALFSLASRARHD